MSCPTPHDWELYESGALSAERHQACSEHLARCPTCRAELSAVRHTDRALQALHAVMPDDHQQRRRELLTALPADAPPARRQPAARVLLLSGLRAAALLAVVVGALWWTQWGSKSQRPTERRLAESMEVVQLVLGHTSETVYRVEQLALQEVVGDQLRGTVDRLPLPWKARATEPRSGT